MDARIINLTKRPVVRADRAMRGANLEPEQVGAFFRHAIRMLEDAIVEAKERHLGILMIRPPFAGCVHTVYDNGDVQLWVAIPRPPEPIDEVLGALKTGNTNLGPLVEPLLCAPENGGKSARSPPVEKKMGKQGSDTRVLEPITRLAAKGRPLLDIALQILRKTGQILMQEQIIGAMQDAGVFDSWASNRAAWLNRNRGDYDETEVAIAFATGLEPRIPEIEIWKVLRTYGAVPNEVPHGIANNTELPNQMPKESGTGSTQSNPPKKPRKRGKCVIGLADKKDAVILFIEDTVKSKGRCTPGDVLAYLEGHHDLKIRWNSLKTRLSQWRRDGCEIPYLSADIEIRAIS